MQTMHWCHFLYHLFIQQKFIEHLHWVSTTELPGFSSGVLRELVSAAQAHQANEQETSGSSRVLLTIKSAVWTVWHAASQYPVMNGLVSATFNFHSPSSCLLSYVCSITPGTGWIYQLKQRIWYKVIYIWAINLTFNYLSIWKHNREGRING